MWGDPCEGRVKTLRIRYRVDDDDILEEVQEHSGDVIRIPLGNGSGFLILDDWEEEVIVYEDSEPEVVEVVEEDGGDLFDAVADAVDDVAEAIDEAVEEVVEVVEEEEVVEV